MNATERQHASTGRPTWELLVAMVVAEGLRGSPLPLSVPTDIVSLVGGGRLGDLGSPGGILSPIGVLGCGKKPPKCQQGHCRARCVSVAAARRLLVCSIEWIEHQKPIQQHLMIRTQPTSQ